MHIYIYKKNSTHIPRSSTNRSAPPSPPSTTRMFFFPKSTEPAPAKLVQLPRPTPGAHVTAIAQNPVDIRLTAHDPREGTIGFEYTGSVVSTGAEATAFSPGERIVGFAFGNSHDNPECGAFGEYGLSFGLSFDYLTLRIPEAMTGEQVVGLPVALCVVWDCTKPLGCRCRLTVSRRTVNW